uniref:Uncharacterized protein n=1 Tax=Arundo donax TaxID=35708 RepID=A0A0A9GIC7_ARUDO
MVHTALTGCCSPPLLPTTSHSPSFCLTPFPLASGCSSNSPLRVDGCCGACSFV